MSLFCLAPITDCGEPEPLLNGEVIFQDQYRSVFQYHCNEPFYSLAEGVHGEIFKCYSKNIINRKLNL